MKNLFLALMITFSGAVLAEKTSPVYPQVYSFGHSVQVTVRNFTDRNVHCSGNIFLNTISGAREMQYYSEFVPARFTSYRNLYPRSFGDRILSTSHSIFCF
jgi:hypothetical protein